METTAVCYSKKLQRYYRPAPNDWKAGGAATKTATFKQQNNQGESLGELTYKCRYLLNKADALYNKGDFEDALVLYHKGLRLRPKGPEFKLGIAKTEDALKVMFEKKEKLIANKSKNEKKMPVTTKRLSPENKENKADDKANENKDAAPKETREKKDEGKSTQEKTDKSTEEPNEEKKERATKTDQEKKEDGESQQPKTKKLLTDQQKEQIKATMQERKERIREARMAFAVKEREEARKVRAKYTSRPSGHLNDDLEFLRMIYKNLKDQTVKNKKVQRITKDAIGYIDTRSNFWNQQIPHHIREKSHVVQMPKGKTPPPTQAMFAFVIKETVRINSMMEKMQWNRAIDSCKKLIEQISKMERKIPNRESVVANIFSIIGNAYLELGDDRKALSYHLKDLNLATDFELEEAKSRSMDNVGRVYARIGEFDKAVAVWEQKMASEFIETTPGERAWLYHEMGYCYMEIDQPEKSKECGQKSYDAATEDKNSKWQLNASLLIAQALLRMGEAYESKDRFEEALAIAEKINDEDAKTKIELALKELDEVLAEWDYMDSDEENEPEQPQQDTQSITSETSHKQVHDDHHHNHAPIDIAIEKPRKSSVYTHSHDDAKPTWLLDVEKEHEQLKLQQRQNQQDDVIQEEDEEDEIKEEVDTKSVTNQTDTKTPILLAPDDPPVTVVYLGSARRESIQSTDNEKNQQKNKDKNKKQTEENSLKKEKPPKVVNKKDATVKEQNKKVGSKEQTVTAKDRGTPKQADAGPKDRATPKQEVTSKANKNQALNREKSSGSFVKPKASRENSNVSLKGKVNKEGSFSNTAVKREASNQSMKGRVSREGSKQSLKNQESSGNETFKPKISSHEETAAIYKANQTSFSREGSITSRKANPRPPKETSLLTKSNANLKNNKSIDDFKKPPSREEKRHNQMVIDTIAALNDPQINDTDDKAFITHNTTATESTVAPDKNN